MDALRHVRLMAEYNRWMNRRLHACAARLDASALRQDRGAYFGSILGTMNHLVVVDSAWLLRFGAPGHWEVLREAGGWLPRGNSPRDVPFQDMVALESMRERIDSLIVAWSEALIFTDLDRVIGYQNLAGETYQRQLGPLLSHFFNHQTHHRGQTGTLLHQAGVDPGVTDLVAMPGFDPFTDVEVTDDDDIPPMPASLAPPAAARVPPSIALRSDEAGGR